MITIGTNRWNLLFFFVLFLTLGCAKDDVQTDTTDPLPEPIRYLALGDSYTIGESVSESDRFPVQLAARLDSAGLEVAETTIVAQTGWTTGRLIEELNTILLPANYDLVTLLIGVNNQFTNGSIDQFELEFRELIDRAIAFVKGKKERIIIVSIPDYAFTPFGQSWGNPTVTSEEIDQFNTLKAAVAAEFGITFVTITDISRLGLEQPELVAGDGLHPSGEMYSLWVDRIFEEARVLFE